MEELNKTPETLKNPGGAELTGYPSIDRPWLKYYNKRPEDLVYPHQTLYQYAWENNKDHLEEIVFQYFDRRITYRTFFENVEKVAKSLAAMGIKAGDIVTIMSMHTPETIYIIYGLNYVGAIANLVYPTLTEKELKKTIEDTDSKVFFILNAVLDKNPDMLRNLEILVVVLSVQESMPLPVKIGYRIRTGRGEKSFLSENLDYRGFLNVGTNTTNAVLASDSKAPAVIVYTSGTTGNPKGVVLSNDSINSYAEQDYAGLLLFPRNKDCLHFLPPFTAIGIVHIHVQICAGIKTIIQIELDADSIHKSLFRYKPYCFMTGPALAESFLDHKPGDLRSCRYYINGGGSISTEQVERIVDQLKRCNAEAGFSNGYGMTEATSALCLGVNEICKSGSVGIPFIDTVVRVVDPETGEEKQYGEVGELWFSSPSLMTGYYKNEKATEETILMDPEGNRWLRTGDLGYVDQDGFVFLKGRLKRIFITMGEDHVAYKLFPRRIEETLLTQGYIAECGVIVIPDEKRMNVAVAFVTSKNINERSNIVEQLNDLAKTELPEHMIPVDIRIIDKMPTTPSGKTDYRELERMYEKDNGVYPR